jgi:hypothetical protein
MSVVPGDIDTDRQPSMVVPLRHFVVALGFLVLGVLTGVGLHFGVGSGAATLAHVHLLLAGWVCVTIMGAMTQFVPVWSGTDLYSRRLATVQLWLVAVGLLGFTAVLLVGQWRWLVGFGAVMALGFWTFVYNVVRTLWGLDSSDVTERHFGIALGFFLLLTILGLVLAVDLVVPLISRVGLQRANVVQAHATLAVFGAILTTILGALYQLATMFTQTELHGIDGPLRRIEEVGYPLGVVALAGGRLADLVVVSRVGGLLLLVALLAFGLILGRRLVETDLEWGPMLSRYAVVVPALALWILLAVPAWIANPIDPAATFGAPGSVHLLLFGVVGFVVVGTLYHVVPFIVWVHRYSDLLGYEPVPMIDDLYDDRLAAGDFWFLLVGLCLLVGGELLGLPRSVSVAGGGLSTVGFVLFLTNVLLVVREHSPYSLFGILAGTATESDRASTDSVSDLPDSSR